MVSMGSGILNMNSTVPNLDPKYLRPAGWPDKFNYGQSVHASLDEAGKKLQTLALVRMISCMTLRVKVNSPAATVKTNRLTIPAVQMSSRALRVSKVRFLMPLRLNQCPATIQPLISLNPRAVLIFLNSAMHQ